jgi:ActR/RegA family two-component response regulator
MDRANFTRKSRQTKSNPHVLFVDDEPSIQFTLARALSMHGCECGVAI